jgi:sugar lactone lactonase YvrE
MAVDVRSRRGSPSLVAGLTGLCTVAVAASLAAGAGAVPGTDMIATVAGTGVAGFAGDGGPATMAQLTNPEGIAVDGAGNLYIADRDNHRVRKVTPAGTISTVAGTGAAGFSGDGGQASAAQLKGPQGVAVDGAGALYIADTGNSRVRRVAPDGVITTVAGSGTAGFSGDGGQAILAQLGAPSALAIDGSANLFILDTNRVRKVAPGGVISTVAGTGTAGFSGDGGPATAAQVNAPEDLAVDAAGNLYIADYLNNRVRKVTPGGLISTFAGTGDKGFAGDGGQAASALLNVPAGLAFDAAGNLYIADYGNNRVRAVVPGGVITTVAGTGTPGSGGDGGPAASAQLAGPTRVAVGGDRLYISDYRDHRIRRVGGGGAGAGTGTASEVDADVIAAAASRNAGGKRVVQLELNLSEQVSATLTLVRAGKTLATKQFAAVKEGERVLTLRAPAATAPGRATLRFQLADQEGNTKRGQRGVRIGNP